MLSTQESFGFFEETDSNWKRRKHIHQMTIREQNRKSRAFDQCQHSAAFWGHNFYPSFTCSYQYKVGNFMVCDPHRIAKAAYGDVSGPVDRKDCLVYSVGSDGYLILKTLCCEMFLRIARYIRLTRSLSATTKGRVPRLRNLCCIMRTLLATSSWKTGWVLYQKIRHRESHFQRL